MAAATIRSGVSPMVPWCGAAVADGAAGRRWSECGGADQAEVGESFRLALAQAV